MEVGNKLEISRILKEYKTENGLVNYNKIFAIKSENRLPSLMKQDYRRSAMLVCAGITLSIEAMNLSRGMNENQIYDLTDCVLDSSQEDNLALEDLMLFLQKLVRGEYGKLYESMDIPKFMEFFEVYREERFQAIRNMRDEFDCSHKPDYSDERLSEKDRHDEQLLSLEAVLNYKKYEKS